MALSLLDWLIIAVYIIFSLGVGLFFYKRASSSTSEYFMAGRTLPWWVVGTSMVATTFAADTPLAITEFVRGPGIWQNWFWWNQLLAGLLGVFLFSRLWRRAEVLTDNELIEVRYSGKPAAGLRLFKAGVFAILYNFIVMGWVINAMASIAAVMLDMDKWLAVWVCVAIALSYSLLSGFWGVVVTDMVQFAIAMFGSIALAVIAVNHVGGMDVILEKLRGFTGEHSAIESGIQQLTAQLATVTDSLRNAELTASLEGLKQQLSQTPNVTENTLSFIPPIPEAGFFTLAFWESPFSQFLVYMTILWWSIYNTDGGGYIIQRMGSAKDERHALLATLWFNLAHYALRVWPWIVVALASMVMFTDLGAHELGSKAGYPLVMKELLGSGMRGILVVSFLAAFMSTIDTHLNWSASYIINDVYKRFFKPESAFKDQDTAQRHYVVISKIATVVLMLMAAYTAIQMQSIEKAWKFIAAMGAGIGLVLILRWFWWRINAWTEIAALSTSLILSIVFELIAYFQTSAAGMPYELFGPDPVLFGVTLQFHLKLLIIVPISIVSWLIVTFLTKPESEATLVSFYQRVQPGGWWAPIEDKVTITLQPVSKGFLGNWIAGVAMIWGTTFAIGQMVFGNWGIGLTLLVLALTGFAYIWKFTISKINV
ncbi:MAG: Na+:solute symporter [Candidatus Marinimicrobia bacterium]|nr:Na+:solute symporter [Candidatus Neomarinimicrobiota bacterium]